MTLVFQYGSNCNVARLNSPDRLNGAAEPIGKARTVGAFEITFDVWSQRNGCATADLVPGGDRKAWGILYEVPDDRIEGSRRAEGQKTLSQIEGPRYEQRHIDVIIGDQVRSAVTFLVKNEFRTHALATSSQYVCHIINGLRDFDVQDDYIQQVIDMAIKNVETAAETAAAEKTALEGLRKARP